MAIARGLVLAFGFFAASFALHIVGGATDQGWLFAIAVALIYVAASGFPAIAGAASGAPRGTRPRQITFGLGVVAGLALTVAALWAANDRAFAWWQAPLAPILVAITTGVVEATLRFREGTRAPSSTAVSSR